ncbi:MAG: ComEC/Rec2 family competence protein [Kiritimatiellae bacterium]|nr:ComEC/Rec2 family competence protein [Kiritimatiellia bacterium]
MSPATGRPAMQARRPLVGFALLFVLGTWCGLALPVPLEAVLCLALLALLGAVLLVRRPAAHAPLALGVVLTAWAAAALCMRSPSPRAVRNLLGREAEHVALIGVVSDDPQAAGEGHGAVRWRFNVHVEGLRRLDHWQKARGRVAVETVSPPGARPYRYGDRWLWEGRLLERARRGPPGRRGHILRAEPGTERLLSAGHGRALLEWCYNGRRASGRTLSAGLAAYPEHAGLLQALLLGYRHELPAALHEMFSATGTLHIFAISGLHVGVVAVLAIAVLTAAGLSRPRWVLALAPLLVLYTLATGMRPSAVRACLMALLFWSAPLFGRRPDGPTALALAAVIILAWAPDQLGDPGFQLSFVVVAGLMALYPRFAAVTRRPFARDPWQLQSDPRGVRWARRALAWGAGLAAASAAAWLASAPLTAACFNVFSPIALLGNLLVIPMAFLVVLTGCLSLVFGSSFILCAEIFNHANRVFISFLLGAIRVMMRLPGGYRFVPAPPWYAVALWYGALAVLLAARRRSGRLLGLGLACLALVALSDPVRRGDVTVDLLAVGQGNAALVDLPGGEDVLVDAGPRFQGDRVRRHLRRQGVNRLGVLILTHADADHVGGALDLLAAVPVAELWCSPYAGRSAVYHDVLAEAERRGVLIRRLAEGERGTWAGGVEWEVLFTDEKPASRRADDASLVLRVAAGGGAVLFMGGASGTVESNLLGRSLEPAASVLVAGDHGTAGTCTEEWLDAVAPGHVVLSVGFHNRRGDPDPGVLERLATRPARVWNTARDGTLRVRFLGNRAARRAGACVEVSPW